MTDNGFPADRMIQTAIKLGLITREEAEVVYNAMRSAGLSNLLTVLWIRAGYTPDKIRETVNRDNSRLAYQHHEYAQNATRIAQKIIPYLP